MFLCMQCIFRLNGEGEVIWQHLLWDEEKQKGAGNANMGKLEVVGDVYKS